MELSSSDYVHLEHLHYSMMCFHIEHYGKATHRSEIRRLCVSLIDLELAEI